MKNRIVSVGPNDNFTVAAGMASKPRMYCFTKAALLRSGIRGTCPRRQSSQSQIRELMLFINGIDAACQLTLMRVVPINKADRQYQP
jgi:hypothetical protein